MMIIRTSFLLTRDQGPSLQTSREINSMYEAANKLVLDMDYLWMVLVTLTVIAVSSMVWRAMVSLVWRPYVITKRFEKQGIKGPPCRFMWGSVKDIASLRKARKDILDVACHDTTQRVLSDYHTWSSQYGEPYLYWFGPNPVLSISDPEMVKQVLSNKFGFYSKIDMGPDLNALFGKGVAASNGLNWARHRRIVYPVFTIDKLKRMTKRMAECTLDMLENWAKEAEQQRCMEIDMKQQFHELSMDIISRCTFSNNHREGKEAFLAQEELQVMASPLFSKLRIPGFQYLPTKKNLHKWDLGKRMKSRLTSIIKRRLDSKDSEGFGNDILGMMLEGCYHDPKANLSLDEIIDNCKTLYFAAHDTTSCLLSWTIFLLSRSTEWQDKVRDEVLRECGSTETIPTADMLGKLKLMTMVILEALRLYNPVNMLLRKANKEMKLGDVMIPEGTIITIPITAIHRDKEYWGEDACEFNPLRFENGASKVGKHPNAMMPFGVGPRTCVGQNFAMLETKLVIAMILQRFSFSLSPNYKHAPVSVTSVGPQFGLPVLVKPLQDE